MVTAKDYIMDISGSDKYALFVRKTEEQCVEMLIDSHKRQREITQKYTKIRTKLDKLPQWKRILINILLGAKI
jgi:predicted RNA-binding protein with RPS1 domain